MRRSILIAMATAGGLVATSASIARADQTDACIDASVRGQELRDQGKLIAAREMFVACSLATCPRLLRNECTGWLADVEARTPSIVVGALDSGGLDVADIKVTLDGEPFLSRLDGQAQPVDPGEHVLRFERAGKPDVEQTVIVREGERQRAITVRLDPEPVKVVPPPPPPPPLGRARPIALATLGGLIVASGVTVAVLGLGAQRDAARLRVTCAPHCVDSQLDPARQKQLGANIALAAGIVAIGAAVAVVVTWPSAPAPALAPSVVIRPVQGGAIAGLSLRF